MSRSGGGVCMLFRVFLGTVGWDCLVVPCTVQGLPLPEGQAGAWGAAAVFPATPSSPLLPAPHPLLHTSFFARFLLSGLGLDQRVTTSP